MAAAAAADAVPLPTDATTALPTSVKKFGADTRADTAATTGAASAAMAAAACVALPLVKPDTSAVSVTDAVSFSASSKA